MKRAFVLFAIFCFMVPAAFASEFLGGRWGVGVETPIVGVDELQAENAVVCDNIFVSYAPAWLSSLQVRFGVNGETLPKAAGNDSGSDYSSKVVLSGIYKLAGGNIEPYVGLKLGVENIAKDMDGAFEPDHSLKNFALVLLGAEWHATDMLSIFASWVPLNTYTIIRGEQVTETKTTLMDSTIFLGMELYL